jgi:hypothetical protein
MCLFHALPVCHELRIVFRPGPSSFYPRHLRLSETYLLLPETPSSGVPALFRCSSIRGRSSLVLRSTSSLLSCSIEHTFPGSMPFTEIGLLRFQERHSLSCARDSRQKEIIRTKGAYAVQLVMDLGYPGNPDSTGCFSLWSALATTPRIETHGRVDKN